MISVPGDEQGRTADQVPAPAWRSTRWEAVQAQAEREVAAAAADPADTAELAAAVRAVTGA